ncbi:MAG: transporter substrate-binding domain-containing protein, partial [Desulfobacteraceae bacterium]|nr:transporter substrate-binding domain-containing protein [Desulfobacteraceae bacterium]
MKFKILLLTVIIINTLALNSHSHQEEIKTIQNTKNIFILNEKEQIYLKDKKVLTMCNNSNWAPIVFAKDGNQNEMQGIAIDILKEIEKRLGIKFKNIHTKNWKEGQQFLKDKKVDILPCYIKSPEREKYANFTRSYLRLPLAIFAARDKPIVSELDEIMDKPWTRQKSSGLIPKLQKQYPNMKIIRT